VCGRDEENNFSSPLLPHPLPLLAQGPHRKGFGRSGCGLDFAHAIVAFGAVTANAIRIEKGEKKGGQGLP